MGALRAIVTGGARGLGAAVADRIVRDGGRVARIDVTEGVDFVGDVSDEEFVERAVPEAAERLGGLDLLVNNAGVGGETGPVVDTAAAVFRRVLEVNLVGSFLVARAEARVMIAQGTGGSMVNFGSTYGMQGVAGGAAYCASKGGGELLTHSPALELAPHGIRVNTIAPGNMATEMHFDYLRRLAGAAGTTFEEEVARVRASVPLGRHGTGEDIAGAVVWLASPGASYVTGQTLSVNGGVLLT